jgi:hypothetical protein
MLPQRSWQSYQITYRRREMEIITAWLSAGLSGSVVGLPGCGRSNLLGFLCNRPDAVQAYLGAGGQPPVLISVDLYNLPANNLSTLYRMILRAFQRVKVQLEPALQQRINLLYQRHEAERDPFLPQSALQEVLLYCQAEQIQVVLVFNHFDQFCQLATRQMVNTLRGLRNDFKDTLSYIAGMSHEVSYLDDPDNLGSMYELLDQYICWVGAMNEADRRQMIAEETRLAASPPGEADMEAILALTGGYPALLKAVCHWWLTTPPRPARQQWGTTLLAERSISYRLEKIWQGLTQEEQFVAGELQKSVATGTPAHRLMAEQHKLLALLANKGICQPVAAGWQLAGELFEAFVAQVEGRGRGRIWLDETSQEIYQGQTLVTTLTELGRALLIFLLKNPRLRHTKTDLIVNVWPEELRREGVSDNSLYQVIFQIRQAIEVNPGQPAYLVNWRGKPEGGYQFFPEGRPR